MRRLNARARCTDTVAGDSGSPIELPALFPTPDPQSLATVVHSLRLSPVVISSATRRDASPLADGFVM